MTTTKTTLKRLFCVFSCCLVVVFSFAFTSSAVVDSAPITFTFSVPNPADTFDGYIILPQTDETAMLVGWYITPQSTYDSDSINNYNIDVNVHIQSHYVSIDFASTQANEKYLVTVYYIENGESMHVEQLKTQFVEFSVPYQAYVRNNSAYFICPNYFKGITRLTHDNYDEYNPANSFPYDCIFSDNITEFKQLEEITTHFTSMLSKMDLTNEQLSSLLVEFNSLLETVYNIDWALSEFVTFYWQEFTYETLPNNIYQITSRLDKIIEALDPKGAEEITTYPDDTFSEFNDIEESLGEVMDNDEVESFLDGGIDGYVDMDTPAYHFIWEFIESAFNSHPEVLLLVFTVLAFGIIALIFNR